MFSRRGKGKPDAAASLCWAEYPDTLGEFKSYQSCKTHDRNTPLHLAGQRTEDRIKQDQSAPIFAECYLAVIKLAFALPWFRRWHQLDPNRAS